MTSVGTAYLEIKGDLSPLRRQLSTDLSSTRLKRTGLVAGGALVAGFAAASAAGKGLFDVGQQFADSTATLRVETGKTAGPLRRLRSDVQSIFKDTPASLADTTTAVGGLAQGLGIAGQPLRHLSKQILELSHITHTDLADNVQSATQLFKNWEVPTRRQAGALDKLFRIFQKTGLSVAENSQLLTTFSAPLRRLGFGFGEAAALFGKFQKEGVNTSKVMAGLRQGLANFTSPTKDAAEALKSLGISADDPKKALHDVFDAIKQAPSELVATQIAFAVFGKRAGPDLAQAIRQGRFELGAFTDQLKDSNGSIDRSARATSGFREQWQILKNDVFLAIEPVATRFFRSIVRGLKIINDPRLTTNQKWDLISTQINRALGEGLNKAVNLAGQFGPKIALSLVRGFLDAPVLVQLAAGGWLLSKKPGLIAKALGLGRAAGTAFATGAGETSAAGDAAGGFDPTSVLSVDPLSAAKGSTKRTAERGAATGVENKVAGGIGAGILARVAGLARTGVVAGVGLTIWKGVSTAIKGTRDRASGDLFKSLQGQSHSLPSNLLSGLGPVGRELGSLGRPNEAGARKVLDTLKSIKTEHGDITAEQEKETLALAEHLRLTDKQKGELRSILSLGRARDDALSGATRRAEARTIGSTRAAPTRRDPTRRLLDTGGELGIAKELGNADKITDGLIHKINAKLRELPPGARAAAAGTVLEIAKGLHDQGKLEGPLDRLNSRVRRAMDGLGHIPTRGIERLASKLGVSAQQLVTAIAVPTSKAAAIVANALDAFGEGASARRIRATVRQQGAIRNIPTGSGQKQARLPRAKGGLIPGMGLRDTVPLQIGRDVQPGDAIVNRHQDTILQRAMKATHTHFAKGGTIMAAPGERHLRRDKEVPKADKALRRAYGFGLGGLFHRVTKPHYASEGGTVKRALTTHNVERNFTDRSDFLRAAKGMRLDERTDERHKSTQMFSGGIVRNLLDSTKTERVSEVLSRAARGAVVRSKDITRSLVDKRHDERHATRVMRDHRTNTRKIARSHQDAHHRDISRSVRKHYASGGIIGKLPEFRAGGWVTGDTDFLPALYRKLEELAKAAKHTIYVQSGGRTLSEQAGLYRKYGPGRAAAPSPNAPHVRGVAADITPGQSVFGGLAPKFGLGFPVPGEPWHIQLMRGGGGAKRDLSAPSTAPRIGAVDVSGEGPRHDLVRGALRAVRTAGNRAIGRAAGRAPKGAGGRGEDITVADGPWQGTMRRIAKERGWSVSDWAWIVSHESGGRVSIKNPSSTAFGLGQLLDSTYATYGGGPGSSGSEQIAAMARYIANRYGNPTKAKSFWEAHRWYSKGGQVDPLHMAGGGPVPGIQELRKRKAKAATIRRQEPGAPPPVAKQLDSVMRKVWSKTRGLYPRAGAMPDYSFISQKTINRGRKDPIDGLTVPGDKRHGRFVFFSNDMQDDFLKHTGSGLDLLLHEWTHTQQRPYTFNRREIAEGSAVLWTRKHLGQVAKRLGWRGLQNYSYPQSTLYDRFAEAVSKPADGKWIDRDQFVGDRKLDLRVDAHGDAGARATASKKYDYSHFGPGTEDPAKKKKGPKPLTGQALDLYKKKHHGRTPAEEKDYEISHGGKTQDQVDTQAGEERRRAHERRAKARARGRRHRISRIIKNIRHNRPRDPEIPQAYNIDTVLPNQIQGFEDQLTRLTGAESRNALPDVTFSREDLNLPAYAGHRILDLGKDDVGDLTLGEMHLAQIDPQIKLRSQEEGIQILRAQLLQGAIKRIKVLIDHRRKVITHLTKAIGYLGDTVEERRKKKPDQKKIHRLEGNLRTEARELDLPRDSFIGDQGFQIAARKRLITQRDSYKGATSLEGLGTAKDDYTQSLSSLVGQANLDANLQVRDTPSMARVAARLGGDVLSTNEDLLNLQQTRGTYTEEGIRAALNGLQPRASEGPAGGGAAPAAFFAEIADILKQFAPNFRAIPAFAKGGISRKTQMALVGEEGPELVQLPIGAKVFKHSETERIIQQSHVPAFGSGGVVQRASSQDRYVQIDPKQLKALLDQAQGKTTNVTNNNVFPAQPPDPHAFSRSIAFELKAAV